MPKIHTLLNLFSNKTGSNETQLIIAAAIKNDRAFVIAHPEKKLSLLETLRAFTYYIKFRLGYPLAYITAHKEFYGLDFLVNRHTLVPRPETELIVDEAINVIKQLPADAEALFVDVGAGSGCIPVAVGTSVEGKKIKIAATDISADALTTAQKNAKRHGVDIIFFHGDLLKPAGSLLKNYSSVIITANLPYLTAEQYKSEPSIRREPKTALVADNSAGLSLYEKLFGQVRQALTASCQINLIIEIDPRQSAAALKMAERHFPSSKIETKKDLAGLDRMLTVKISN